MVRLHGQDLTRRQLAERAGMLSQVAGVRLMTLGDGVERGIRMLEFRTGTGLRFTALVDRALDIADFEYKGQAIGWHSASGFRHPGLHDYEGEGGLAWTRSFSGLVLTCGLDHIGFTAEVPSLHYDYPPRATMRHSLHGRISTIPARLTGYGERWEGDRCFLWAEAVVQQAAVFAENLHLIRRIEAEVGGNEVRLSDRVVNQGFQTTPHMFFYHVNVSYPLLDEGARYVAPIRDVVWASHAETYRDQGAGYRTLLGPQPRFTEQVWEHDLAADAAGLVPVAVLNDRLGLGFELESRKDQLPCAYQWQSFRAGQYTMGVEPSTHHALGDLAARERGEIIWLEHGDSRSYEVAFRVLDGAAEIAAAEARIAAIAQQPDTDFPPPSGAFARLWGAR
ncbi:MAG: aldose 1-epimerase family protein [Amaricoccus sp.]